jgi:hypothetical protein
MVNSFSAGVSSFFPSGFLACPACLGKHGNIPRGETAAQGHITAFMVRDAATRLLTMRV